jgi:hypothetical protein
MSSEWASDDDDQALQRQLAEVQIKIEAKRQAKAEESKVSRLETLIEGVMDRLDMINVRLERIEDTSREKLAATDQIVACVGAIEQTAQGLEGRLANMERRIEASEVKGVDALRATGVEMQESLKAELISICQNAEADRHRLITNVPPLFSLDLTGMGLDSDAAGVIASYICGNKVLRSLNVSNNKFGAEGTKRIVEALKSSEGVLSSLNLANNKLGQPVLPEGWTKIYSKHRRGFEEFKHTDGRVQQEDPSQCLGTIALVDAIKNIGTLLVLDISNNSIGGVKSIGGEFGFWNLKVHSEGPQAIAEALESNVRDIMSMHITSANICHDKGALTTLTFGDKQVVTMTTEMTEANFSGKLESYEARIVTAFLPKCT